MSHDHSSLPSSTAMPKLHSGLIRSIWYTAYMLAAVIVLAPVVMLSRKRD